jgi:hypothetical protein
MRFDDVDGNECFIGTTLTDPHVTFTPAPDGYSGHDTYTFLGYTVNDGLATSDPAYLTISVLEVDDTPRATKYGDLFLWEDQPLHFFMGGLDVEGDRFRMRMVDAPFLRGFLIQHWIWGDIAITTQPRLFGESDTASNWPMSFEPFADDYDEDNYNSFSYVVEEIKNGILSSEARITFRVRPVNDAPVMTIDGIGTAQSHALEAAVVSGGTYALPTLAFEDKPNEIGPSRPDEALVTFETTGGGHIAINTFFLEAASIEVSASDTRISFAMPYDISAITGLPGTTIDTVLNSLRYTPMTAGPDTLTLTVNDQGSFGACAPDDPMDPCPKETMTVIDLEIEAGTPPAEEAVMTLIPALP